MSGEKFVFSRKFNLIVKFIAFISELKKLRMLKNEKNLKENERSNGG